MTAAASVPRRRPAVRLLTLLTAASLAAIACGCSAEDGTLATTTEFSAVGTRTPSIPAADEIAIRSTIDSVNSTAADAVSVQQATLASRVAPDLAAALQECPPATTTLRFEPIYSGLRPSPGWTGSSGELAGTVYALPTLIRIYTGDRVTGTDLTTLHLGVQQGEAFLTPLCVG